MAPKTTKKLQLLLSIKWYQISMITNQFLIPYGIDNLLELYFSRNTNQLRNYIVTYNIILNHPVSYQHIITTTLKSNNNHLKSSITSS